VVAAESMQAPEQLTDLLNAARSGDSDAAQAAYELVYAELKRWAAQSLRRLPTGATLTPTALVHEVYVRFSEHTAKPLRDRGHFFALAARAMRQILIDHARKRGSRKRGGDAASTDLDSALNLRSDDLSRALEIDDALRTLESRDTDLAKLVEWHFFAGLNFQEIAEATGRHERTVRRDWELARAFLRRELGQTA
jgi:RNA polymerase sigma factor (TIGR02999 family)